MADIYFLLNNAGIGGAEKRMLRVASRIAQEELFANAFLLINSELWEEYNREKNLINLFTSSKLQLRIIELSNNRSLFAKVVHKLSRLLKFQLLVDYANYLTLKEQSYLDQLLAITNKGDVIHTFFGNESRNGALLAASRGRTVIIEITSNRHLERISSHFTKLLRFQKASSSLYIKCVSDTVHNNFLKILPSEAQKKIVQVEVYPFTYVEPIQNRRSIELDRKNLIIFGHRFVAPKNPILFAEIVKELHHDGKLSGWRVLFRGKGQPLENELRNILANEIADGIVDIAYSRDFPTELLSTKIFVSIIETGNYPSQSVLEAMQAGNLLLLSDTGQTKEKFFHKDACFPPLRKDEIKSCLLQLMAVAESDQFQQISLSMQTLYREIADRDEYIQSLLKIYTTPSGV